jgi:hypothetical protein
VALLDGPEAGGIIPGWPGLPPDQLVVFRSEILAPGLLLACADDGVHELMVGDLVYRQVSRSQLLELPPLEPVVPGAAYTFVRHVAAPAEAK